jgi:inner membrane protein involved in colicin E2 resistance
MKYSVYQISGPILALSVFVGFSMLYVIKSGAGSHLENMYFCIINEYEKIDA